MFQSSKKRPAARRAAARFRLGLERLEQRAMMTVGAVLQGNTLIVTGSSNDDAIVVAPTAMPGQVAVTINGTSYGNFSPASATVSGLDGSDDIVVAGVPAKVIGGSGNDRVTGPDVDGQIWNITGKDAGTVGTLQFSEIERLKGGFFGDVFRFGSGGSISRRVEGNDGFDTLDYSLLSGPIRVNDNTHTATRVGGTYFGIEILIGSAASNDTLTNNGHFVVRDSVNSGATHRTDSAGYLRFSAIENLASSAANTFDFFSGGSLTGRIDAASGSLLSYRNSGISTGVAVDLTAGTASRVGGGISGIRDVYGTIGNDLLIGDSKNNHLWGDDGNDIIDGRAGNDILDGGSNEDIVLGGTGNDLLDGGTGEDILIGGAGSDTLVGNYGNDILIAGKANSYDRTLHSNAYANLQMILQEWTRTDLGYHGRIDHLRNGGGLNGNKKLNSSTLSDDEVADTLTGNLGNDWFIIGKKKDTVTDANVPTTEVITKL